MNHFYQKFKAVLSSRLLLRIGAVMIAVLFLAVSALVFYANTHTPKEVLKETSVFSELMPNGEEVVVQKSNKLKEYKPKLLQAADKASNALYNANIKAPMAIGEATSEQLKMEPPVDLVDGSDNNPAEAAGNPTENGNNDRNVAPYGRLIPCQTVLTIDSTNTSTPVVAMVSEDVYNEGEVLIPAGTEVHGQTSAHFLRDRVFANGSWIFVFREPKSAFCGQSLVLQGIALDMDRDLVAGKWGLTDGSAGIRGQVVRDTNIDEIKMFVAKFMGSAASALQTREHTDTVLGSIDRTVGTAKNAILGGASDALNSYAEQVLEEIKKNGSFVRVPSGTQFYLYLNEPIDLSKLQRRVGNILFSQKKGETT